MTEESAAAKPFEPDGAAVPPPAPAETAASLVEAARRSSIGRGLADDASLGESLRESIGGVRGVVEVTLPGLLFVIVYAFTQDLALSLIAPAVVGALFLAIRVLRQEPIAQAVGGLLATAVSVGLALWSGRGEDYYLPGFWTNGAYGAALLLSVLVGWPVVGLIAGLVAEDGIAWKKDRRKVRIFSLLTLVFVAMFALRLAVQLPLYFAGNVEALGITRILMGLPLFAPVLVLTWFVSRAVYSAGRASDASDVR